MIALVAATALVACQPMGTIDSVDPRIAAGAARTCAELELSEVRCTLVTLRARKALDAERPQHADVRSFELHEAGPTPAGQSPLPGGETVAAVVVFTLDDGSRIGVPVICPTEPGGTDPTCNPQLE